MSTRTQTWEVASRGQTLVRAPRADLSLAAHETNWGSTTGEMLRCDLALYRS